VVDPDLSDRRMTVNEKRWRDIGQGSFVKWETPGQEIEGTWHGTKPGKFGDLGIIETMEGRVSFPLHTTLAQDLQLVKEGGEVRVRYLGKRKTKDGAREYKHFQVSIAGDGLAIDDDEKPVPF
jgi:hypothetical protein